MVRTCRKVPDEWGKYEPVGQLIENTRIFAFKTPLRLELRNRIQNARIFTTQDLFRKLAESGKTLGLVINATNTQRYYDRADVEGMLIGYKEIPCPGRGFLVRNDLVKSFCKTVDEFMSANQDNDYLIGVHCTNGVNRSGYLICRYLIDRLGWSSHDALNAFEIARGYPIERGSFVQALHRADRERRLKSKHDAVTEAGGGDAKAERKKKRKRKDDEIDEEIPGLDPALTAQMMQQFFQMEQQFKEAAESAISGNTPTGLSASPYDGAAPGQRGGVMVPSPITAAHSPATSYVATGHHNQQQQSYTPNGSVSYTRSVQHSFSHGAAGDTAFNQTIESQTTTGTSITDYETNEEDASLDRVVDFESMGKVDVRETSNSEFRRARRKRLDKQFQVMKRGRFWEINEMRKDMGL